MKKIRKLNKNAFKIKNILKNENSKNWWIFTILKKLKLNNIFKVTKKFRKVSNAGDSVFENDDLKRPWIRHRVFRVFNLWKSKNLNINPGIQKIKQKKFLEFFHKILDLGKTKVQKLNFDSKQYKTWFLISWTNTKK